MIILSPQVKSRPATNNIHSLFIYFRYFNPNLFLFYRFNGPAVTSSVPKIMLLLLLPPPVFQSMPGRVKLKKNINGALSKPWYSPMANPWIWFWMMVVIWPIWSMRNTHNIWRISRVCPKKLPPVFTICTKCSKKAVWVYPPLMSMILWPRLVFLMDFPKF